MNFFCISCYFKGGAFLRACKEAGNTVYLLTAKKLEHDPWPRESVDEFFYLENDSNHPANLNDIAKGFGWIMWERGIDRIVALDDFDVEKAAYLREEFRLPGMGQTTARYFRDKLAMRMRAREHGIPVPAFSGLFGERQFEEFVRRVDYPCLLKPRGEASATGISKVHTADDLRTRVRALNEERRHFLIEEFRSGDVYHVDAISVDGEIVFSQVSRYLSTPFEVAHGGGIFRSVSVPYHDEEAVILRRMTEDVMHAFGMRYSASHTEFIRTDRGFVFLETASRVGGAHLAEMVEAASGVDLWQEWARLETAMARGEKYTPPQRRYDQAGIVVSLSRYERPDTAPFTDPEIVWRMDKKHHIGLIVASDSALRIHHLLDDYAGRIARDYHASAPAPDKAAH